MAYQQNRPLRGDSVRRDTNFFSYSEDVDAELFEDPFVRQGFIRKVYAILFVQLLVTLGIILFFRYYEPACTFVTGPNSAIYWYSLLGASFVPLLILVCCYRARHIFPINFMLLGMLTLIEGAILGGLTCRSKSDIFLMAVGITAAVVIALSLFAIQTRCDFTICIGVMIVVCVVALIMGILCIFIRNKILHIVYASLGTVVFCIFLVIDTQLIVGGNRQYSIAPDEYILGALHLYIDIVAIFAHLYALLQMTN